MKPISPNLAKFLPFFFTLFFTNYANATIYITVADGNWNSNNTWMNGNKPNSNNIGNNDEVYIYHHVSLQGQKLEIDGNQNTKVVIDNGSLGPNGNGQKELIVKNGLFKAVNSEVTFDFLENYDQFELENSCFTLRNGNFKFDGASGIFNSACIVVDNGNFENQGGSSMTGTGITALWVKNGNVDNSSSSWQVMVDNYHIANGNNGIPAAFQGLSQNNTWMTNHFSTCSCIIIQNVETVQTGYWDDPGTWLGGVIPTTNAPTTIKAGHAVTMRNNNSVMLDNLIIETGASVLSFNNERLTIMEDLSNDGMVERLKIKGQNRTISNIGEVNELEIDMDATTYVLTCNNRILINEEMKIESGALDSDVEFKSNSSGTAIFDESGSGSWSNGSAYVNTFLNDGNAGWRYWASPVWNNSTWSVGGFPLQSSNGTTLVYRYIETLAINDPADGWLAQGMAYLHPLAFSMYVGQHPDVANGKTYTITANGALQTGAISLTHLMSYTGNAPNNPNVDPRGWTIMGNPFQSSLDWDAISADPAVTNIESTYYMWDPQFQNYESYNANTGVGTGGLDRYIRPHHGVFIKQTGPGATLVLNDSHKDYTYRTSGMNRMNTSTAVPTLELSMNSTSRKSSIVVRFGNGTLGYDAALDNRNLTGMGSDLIEFSSNAGLNTVDLQVNTVDTLGSTPKIIPLSNAISQFENLTIRLDNAANIPTGTAVYLFDKNLAVQHDLCQGAYSYTSDQNDVNDRFELRVVPQMALNTETLESNNVQIYAASNHIFVELEKALEQTTMIQVVNTTGQVVANIRAQAGQTNYVFECNQLLQKNMYIVSIPSLDVSQKIRW